MANEDAGIPPLFKYTPSFLRAPAARVEDVKPGMVAVGGAPYSNKSEGGLRIWAREGAKGVREASLSFAEQLEIAGDDGLLDVDRKRRLFRKDGAVVDVGDYVIYPTDVFRTTESIAHGVYEITKRGGYSVALGGNHYLGYPSCLGFTRAVAEKNPRVRVGYIHFDGHLDFGYNDPLWGKYNSGTNARRISELEVVRPSSMVWIGIQGACSLEQVEAIRRNGGTIFTCEDVYVMGPSEVGKRAGELASKGCDFIDLSLDIDCLDSGLSPGTGSITQGALTPQALMTILDELAPYPIGAIDLIEVDPPKDPSGRTQHFAMHTIIRLLSHRLFRVEDA